MYGGETFRKIGFVVVVSRTRGRDRHERENTRAFGIFTHSSHAPAGPCGCFEMETEIYNRPLPLKKPPPPPPPHVERLRVFVYERTARECRRIFIAKITHPTRTRCTCGVTGFVVHPLRGLPRAPPSDENNVIIDQSDDYSRCEIMRTRRISQTNVFITTTTIVFF